MKTKLVLWGKNEQDERVLIASELITNANQVKTLVFKEPIANEELSKVLMDEWRDDKEVELPQEKEELTKELSMTESMLPEGLTAERDDLVQRAQTEWHFVVLSAKLHNSYHSELEDLKERVNNLSSFDKQIWEELKGFWNKVQAQVREKNLFWDHADMLRDQTNALFANLKRLRQKLDEEFEERSKGSFEDLQAQLDDIEKRISDGLRLQAIFEELKNLQRQFRNIKLTKEHREKIWERLDSSFKTVKEKRFGPDANKDRSPMERLRKRYEGLLAAIEKMGRSITRDEDELGFQEKKISRSEGQLEAQIRQAKVTMIEERIRSKKEKLSDMKRTQTELEQKMKLQEQKEAKRKEREQLEEAKRKVQEEIKERIEQKSADLEEKVDAAQLEKAAADLKASKKKGPEASEKSKPKQDKLKTVDSDLTKEGLHDVVATLGAIANAVEHSGSSFSEEPQAEVLENKEEKS